MTEIPRSEFIPQSTTTDNHAHKLHGLCPVCDHYGDDCTGTMTPDEAAANAWLQTRTTTTDNEAGMLAHLDDLADNIKDLVFTAKALLLKVEGMTSAEFTIGGEREERNALRATLTRLGELEPDGN